MPTPKFDPNVPYQVEAPKFDPSAPYEVASPLSLTDNTGGEGTYRMGSYDFNQGNVTKPEISVPFSKVNDALQAGYKLHPDEQARFQKDFTHQGEGPTLLEKARSLFDAATQPVADQPLPWNTEGHSVGTFVRSLPAAFGNVETMPVNLVNRAARTVASLPQGVAQTASDLVAGRPQGIEALDPVSMAEGTYQNLQSDAQTLGPAAAWSNLGGDAAAMVAAGEAMPAGVDMLRRGASAAAAAPGVMGSAVRRLVAGDVNAPMPETGVTPAARYGSMRSTGVQPNAAEATNSKLLNMAERVNQHSLTSAGTYADARGANLKALNDYTEDVLKGMSPDGMEDGGAAVQRGLLKSHADLKEAATQAFKDLDKQVGDQPLPGATGLRQQAQAILDQNAPYYKEHPEFEPTKAMAIVRDLAGAKAPGKAAPAVISGFGPAPAAAEVAPPRVPTYSELHRLRSDLLDFNNTNPDLVKNQANGWISQLAGAADHAITSGQSLLTPEQVQTFRNANEAWKYMKATYDNPSHPFYQAVRTPDASTLLKGLRQTPEMAKALQTALGPEGIGPIQRGVAEKALGTTKDGGYNFRNFQGMWNKLPKEYREALFTQEQIRHLEDIGNAGTVLHEDVNPSGTAKLGQAQAEMGEGFAALGAGGAGHFLPAIGTGAYHAAQYGLGRLMNNPRFVDWLMRGRGFAPIEDVAPAATLDPHIGPNGQPNYYSEEVLRRRAPFAAAASAAMAGGAASSGRDPAKDPHTGPNGQPNYYSDEYLKAKAAFDAAREKEQ